MGVGPFKRNVLRVGPDSRQELQATSSGSNSLRAATFAY